MDMYTLCTFLNERFDDYNCVIQYSTYNFDIMIEFRTTYSRDVRYTLVLVDRFDHAPYLEFRDDDNNVLTRINYVEN